MFTKVLFVSAFATLSALAGTVWIQPINGAGIHVDNESSVQYSAVPFDMDSGNRGFHVIWSSSNNSPYVRSFSSGIFFGADGL